MNVSSLNAMIDRELADVKTLDNWHGIRMDNIAIRRLQIPTLTRFENAGAPDDPSELDAWIVLDECPDSDSQGYLVAYYQDVAMFGLALKNDPIPTFIGCYGNFIETVNAM